MPLLKHLLALLLAISLLSLNLIDKLFDLPGVLLAQLLELELLSRAETVLPLVLGTGHHVGPVRVQLRLDPNALRVRLLPSALDGA